MSDSCTTFYLTTAFTDSNC